MLGKWNDVSGSTGVRQINSRRLADPRRWMWPAAFSGPTAVLLLSTLPNRVTIDWAHDAFPCSVFLLTNTVDTH